MVIVVKVEESASMRRKLAKHKSNQGEEAGNNLRSDTRHTNIASKEGPSRELSSLPIYNGEVFLNVLRNQIFVVMVAILAILFVFVGNGQASSNLVTTPIGLETHEKAGFSLKPRIVHYITTNNVVVKSRIQSIMKMPVEFLDKKEIEFLDRKDNEPEEESAILLAALTLVGSPDDSLTEINRWEIKQFPFTIGREDCDITIQKDRHVSRKHAQISFENNDYLWKDYNTQVWGISFVRIEDGVFHLDDISIEGVDLSEFILPKVP